MLLIACFIFSYADLPSLLVDKLHVLLVKERYHAVNMMASFINVGNFQHLRICTF